MNLLNKLKVNTSLFFMKKPLPYPLIGKEGKKAKEAIKAFKSLNYLERIHVLNGKTYKVFTFNADKEKKALVIHGWMSASAFMVMQITNFIDQGYKVIAVDFPGHGEAKRNFFLTWRDAVNVILDTQKHYGPFDVALGHSFGGGMLINATGLQNISSEFTSQLKCPKFILLASALSINVPVRLFSKTTRLNNEEITMFREKISKDASLRFEYMSGKYLETNYPTDSRFLLIHGDKDGVVKIEESIEFSTIGNRAQLIAKRGMGHLEIIHSEEVIQDINDFINKPLDE
jgi:pimeloyl-ACP methyl ester carboxylesterase